MLKKTKQGQTTCLFEYVNKKDCGGQLTKNVEK